MTYLILILLILNLTLLIRINSKLPGKDLVQEALDRYNKEKAQK